MGKRRGASLILTTNKIWSSFSYISNFKKVYSPKNCLEGRRIYKERNKLQLLEISLFLYIRLYFLQDNVRQASIFGLMPFPLQGWRLAMDKDCITTSTSAQVGQLRHRWVQ